MRARGISYLIVGDAHVDLPVAISLSRSELGVTTVVCTGDGRLGGALLRAGLVDEVDVDLLPVVIGGWGSRCCSMRHRSVPTSGRSGWRCSPRSDWTAGGCGCAMRSLDALGIDPHRGQA